MVALGIYDNVGREPSCNPLRLRGSGRDTFAPDQDSRNPAADEFSKRLETVSRQDPCTRPRLRDASAPIGAELRSGWNVIVGTKGCCPEAGAKIAGFPQERVDPAAGV